MGKHPKYSNWEFAEDLWHFFRNYKREFILFSFMLVIASSLELVPAIILAKIIDFFTTPGEPIGVFYMYLGILTGVEIIATIIRRGAKYRFGLFSIRIQKEIKVESFQKLIQKDLIWHDATTTGINTQKIMEGERALNKIMDFYKEHGISMVVSVIGIIGIFAFFNIKYSLFAILFMFTYLLVEFKFNKRVAQKTLQVKLASEIASGKAIEFSSNIHTIKSLGIEKSSHKQIEDKEEILLQAKKERRKVNNMKLIIVQIIASIFAAIFIFIVGGDVLRGVLTVGSIVIYIFYLARLHGVLNLISGQATSLINAKYGIYRMMEIYREVPDINEENAKNLKDWKEIKIENVSFKYKGESVLDGFSLDIKKGEKIGIVGRSGSGKSTLFKLLLKLYLPQKGTIYFDDKPITKIKRESILGKISIVPQETELFNLSLKDNITISRAGRIDYGKYIEALRASKLDEVIYKLKNRDLSLIGEKGVRLSGGERQRLGIARAIYKDSDIIILDEATSNLDYATEREVQEELNKLKNKTLIVSAHRLQTLKNMDKIIFIDKGRVVEQGTYDELLRKRGEFYKLWRKQGAWKFG